MQRSWRWATLWGLILLILVGCRSEVLVERAELQEVALPSPDPTPSVFDSPMVRSIVVPELANPVFAAILEAEEQTECPTSNALTPGTVFPVAAEPLTAGVSLRELAERDGDPFVFVVDDAASVDDEEFAAQLVLIDEELRALVESNAVITKDLEMCEQIGGNFGSGDLVPALVVREPLPDDALYREILEYLDQVEVPEWELAEAFGGDVSQAATVSSFAGLGECEVGPTPPPGSFVPIPPVQSALLSTGPIPSGTSVDQLTGQATLFLSSRTAHPCRLPDGAIESIEALSEAHGDMFIIDDIGPGVFLTGDLFATAESLEPLDVETYVDGSGELLDQWLPAVPGNPDQAAVFAELRDRQYGPFSEFRSEDEDIPDESIQHVLTSDTAVGSLRFYTWTLVDSPTNSLACYGVLELPDAGQSCSANSSRNRLESWVSGQPRALAILNADDRAAYAVVQTESGVTVGAPVIDGVVLITTESRFGSVTDVDLMDERGREIRSWFYDDRDFATDGKREDYVIIDLAEGQVVPAPDGAPEGDVYVSLDTSRPVHYPSQSEDETVSVVLSRLGDIYRPVEGSARFIGTVRWDLGTIDLYDTRVIDVESGVETRCVVEVNADQNTDSWSCNGTFTEDGVTTELAPANSTTLSWGNGRNSVSVMNPSPGAKWMVVETHDGNTIVAAVSDAFAYAEWRESWGVARSYILFDADLNILHSDSDL